MRNLLVLSAAASALALVSTHQVAALSPGATATSPHGLVHQAQKSDDTPGAQGKDGAQRGAEPGQRSQGGNRSSTAQDKGGNRSSTAQDKGGNRSSTAQDKGGERSTNMRSTDKSARGGRQHTNVDVNVNRGRHGQRDRLDRRARVGVAVDNRHRSRRDVNVGVRSYGYSNRGSYGYSNTSCQEILRRYKQCVGH